MPADAQLGPCARLQIHELLQSPLNDKRPSWAAPSQIPR